MLQIVFEITLCLDIVIPAHMLEIFDFPTAIRTQDLLKVNDIIVIKKSDIGYNEIVINFWLF